MIKDFFKTNLITVLGVSVGVLIGGSLLFAVISFYSEVGQLKTLEAQDRVTLQQIVDFLNKSIAAQQQAAQQVAQPAPQPTTPAK